MFEARVKRVAVIGAGGSGLVTAREMRRAGHEVVVFEGTERLGGVWVHSQEAEDDLLGLSPSRRIHSSLYDSLRTNLPGKLMAYRDFPFDGSGGGEDSWPIFLYHRQVKLYLERFAECFDLKGLIRLGSAVEKVERRERGGWSIALEGGGTEVFDAVAVCNGHYSKPRVPRVEGIETFEGKLYHSHNYRTNAAFAGKRVALLGVAASGVDIAREIAEVAAHVFWCGDGFRAFETEGNVTRAPAPSGFDSGGRLRWEKEGCAEALDIFMFCTGYHYDFPFLESGFVDTEDNWVRPLYRDLVSAREPTLAFVGIPYSVIPFPLFEAQSKWLAAVWSGGIALPEQGDMLQEVEEKAGRLRAAGVKTRNFHKYGAEQYEYMDTFYRECGGEALPDWFAPMAEAIRLARAADPIGYRESFRV